MFLKDGLFKKGHDLSCTTPHEKQHFRKSVQRKYHISLISDIFRNKSIGQDLDDK